MMSADEIDIGHLVQYKGKDGIVMNVESPLGFKQYKILLLEDGLTYTASKYELNPSKEADWLMMEMELPMDEEGTNPGNNRFEAVSDQAINELASSRLSKTTMQQTSWAVKIFRGGLKSF